MVQASARFEAFNGSRAALAHVLGIGEADVHPDLPVLYGSTGLWTLVVPVRTLDTIRRMKPLTAEFPSVLVEMPSASIHPFCLETTEPSAHMHARHFSSPRSGTVEDPVTGTASGVLGAYYLEFIKAETELPLLVEQGQEVGRDGRVLVWAEKRNGKYHVRVGGTGCFVREMLIDVPHD